MLPVARQRLRIARFFKVPTTDWLTPIDHSAIARLVEPNRRAAATMSSAGTPHTAAARAGVHSAAIVSASSAPRVWRSRKTRSSRPSRSSTCSIAFSSGRSVPGRTGRCRSACSAVGVRRGSATIRNAPRLRIRFHTIG